MCVLTAEKLYKLRILIFVFKNKGIFQIHDSVSYSKTGGGVVAAYPRWKKHHSRIQARYRGFELFNRLPNYVRREKSQSKFKNYVNTWLAVQGRGNQEQGASTSVLLSNENSNIILFVTVFNFTIGDYRSMLSANLLFFICHFIFTLTPADDDQ